MRALDCLERRAVLIGTIVVLGLIFVYCVLLGVLAVYTASDPYAVLRRPGTLVGGTVLSLIFTGLGGHAAAKRVARGPLWNAAAVGVLCVAIGLLMGVASMGSTRVETPLWLDIASYVLTIPAALLGGLVARAQYKYRADSA